MVAYNTSAREYIPLQNLDMEEGITENRDTGTLGVENDTVTRITGGGDSNAVRCGDNEDHDNDSTGQETPDFNDFDALEPYFDTSPLGKLRKFFYFAWNGPRDPRDDPPPKIQPLIWFEKLPNRLLQSILKKLRVSLVVVYLTLWFMTIYSIVIPYYLHPTLLTTDTSVKVIALSCQSLLQFWKGKNGACGLNGEQCPSFLTEEDVIFRCPALCDRGSWTYSLIPIGDQRIKHRGYFVGGGKSNEQKYSPDQISNPYRADSYPCGAGVHAGIISPFSGGCARISYSSGGQPYFKSTKGSYGVSDSIEFVSYFPSSFFFKKLHLIGGPSASGTFNQCYDPRLLVLVLNIILGLPIVYLVGGIVSFWVTNIVGFWTIILATDPPYTVDASDPETFASLLSIGLERFLPSCFVLYVLWSCSTKRALKRTEDSSPLWEVILWYPLFWLGVINNMTFDRLPVDRLTLSDLREQSGALLAVLAIITTILICAVIQAYKIWLSGRFRKYLAIYGSFVMGLILLSSIPNLTLRIHHYILAMLLLPGCATRGRTAIAFQGILLGLFLSGSARWGFAAIAETVSSLRRDDPSGDIKPPTFVGFNLETGILTWKNATDLSAKYNGISLLVNDIERYVGEWSTSVNLTKIITSNRELSSGIELALALSKKKAIPLYLRMGLVSLEKNHYGDYTNAAVLQWPSGDLKLPVPGLT